VSAIQVTADGDVVTLAIPVAGKMLRVRITSEYAQRLAAQLMMAAAPAMLRIDEQGKYVDA
jgi:hypothetical protein